MSLRDTFESVADTYESARPSYPEVLFDDTVDIAGLGPGDRLLEVGCATGKATRPMLERGFTVVCVELGARLAESARRKLSGYPVEVHVAPFEEWTTESAEFDLVYAATAWHWLDPEIRFRKAHHLLRPGGHLAFWSATHAFPEGFDPFFTEIQDVYAEIGESHPGVWPPAPPEQTPDERADIDASDLFETVGLRRYLLSQRYETDDYIALLDTFSGHIAMPKERREHLYREIRARLSNRPTPGVDRHWSSILHVARRKEM